MTQTVILRGDRQRALACEMIQSAPVDGVVRISAVHYNTPEEIDRIFEVLTEHPPEAR